MPGIDMILVLSPPGIPPSDPFPAGFAFPGLIVPVFPGLWSLFADFNCTLNLPKKGFRGMFEENADPSSFLLYNSVRAG